MKQFKVVFGIERTKTNMGIKTSSFVKENPVNDIRIVVWAETVSDAICKAWQATTVSPNVYSIISITMLDGYYYIRNDEEDDDT